MNNRSNASQWEFVAAVHQAPWRHDFGHQLSVLDSESQLEFRKKLETSLQRAFDEQPATDTLLLSSEHFQSRLTETETIQELKSFLEPWVERFEIVVYFRRQDELALSFVSTRLKSNSTLGELDVLSFIRRTPQNYDHLSIFERWQKVFGEVAMKPRVFEEKHWPGADLLRDFCATCGLKEPKETARTLNKSLNRKGFHFLNVYNRMFPLGVDDSPDATRKQFVVEVSNLCAGKYYPISREQALAFYAEYSESNESLRKIAFPDFPEPLFSQDFSEYPDIAESFEPDYQDAVEIAAQIWRPTKRESQREPKLLQRILNKFGGKSE